MIFVKVYIMGKIRKEIIDLSSAESVQSVIKVNFIQAFMLKSSKTLTLIIQNLKIFNENLQYIFIN